MTQTPPKPAAPRHHYHADMLSVEEARDRILSYFSVLPAEETPLLDCLGLVLAEDLVSPIDVPPLPNSAMDGYAVRSMEVQGATPEFVRVLPVSQSIAAGQVPHEPLRHGTVARIMTGAPVPVGADAVVPFEDTDEAERGRGQDRRATIGIKSSVTPGSNTRPAGEDIKKGVTVLKAGTVMRPGEIGVAASIGRSTIKVVRRPVVAIISTGDELIEPGETFRPGSIYNSNAYSIAAAVTKCGGMPWKLGIARDAVESLEAALATALGHDKPAEQAGQTADMVVTSAGVSKGDYDVVKDVLARRGQIALWSVRMRPAKPLAFGTLDGPGGRKVPHLGLPGNPVSAMVAFEQFGRPALRLMSGRKQAPIPTVQAVLDDPIVNADGRRVYARVVVYRGPGGAYHARTTGNQSSGALTSMAAANGFAICPDDIASMGRGDTVSVEMFDWPEEVF